MSSTSMSTLDNSKLQKIKDILNKIKKSKNQIACKIKRQKNEYSSECTTVELIITIPGINETEIINLKLDRSSVLENSSLGEIIVELKNKNAKLKEEIIYVDNNNLHELEDDDCGNNV